jgi:hypothetical protein
MMTLWPFARKFESLPALPCWTLADLGEARGRQKIFTHPSPHRPAALQNHVLVERAASSESPNFRMCDRKSRGMPGAPAGFLNRDSERIPRCLRRG